MPLLPNLVYVNLSSQSSCIMFCPHVKSIALLAFFHDYVLFCSYKCTIFHVDVNLFLIPSHLLFALVAGTSSHLNVHLCYVLIMLSKIHILKP